MPYSAPGVRVKKTNGTVAAYISTSLKHGDLINYEGIMGVVAKSSQVDRWTLPANATKIAPGEEFVIMVGGVIEAVMAGVVGNLVNVAASTTGAPGALGAVTVGAAGPTTIGVIQQVDTTRSPQVVRINTNFQPGAA